MQEQKEIQDKQQQQQLIQLQNNKPTVEGKGGNNMGQQESEVQKMRQQLLSMQFEPHLIEKALLKTTRLEQAIEYIINLLEEQDLQEIHTNDIMGMGKIAAQCAHATLKSFQIARNLAETNQNYALTFIRWLQSGQEKVYYKVESEEELSGLLKQFREVGASTSYIRDAGRTQIAAGSLTVGGIGPFSSQAMQAITKRLRRL